MQYRGLLFIPAMLFVCVADLAAQPVDSSFYKYQNDTIIIKKGLTPDRKLMADALIAQPTVFKRVPMATDSTYFGEKLDYVNNYTQKYLKNHNRTLSTVKERAEQHFPLIDNILAQNKLPKELKYLAVIESALNNHARSRVGAVGPWQFMSYTGREMGLVVNRNRDDRKDWARSTRAAAMYLTQLYQELDDWLLVIAAYNSGPRPVIRAIQRTGSTNFWDIKHLLPRETQGHVLAFIATTTIFERLDHYIGKEIPDVLNYDKKILLKVEEKKANSPFTEAELKSMAIVRLSEPISLDLMAQELGMDIKLLTRWNGDYDLFEYGTYSSDEYSLRIPKEKLENFLGKKEYLTKRSKEVFSSQNM